MAEQRLSSEIGDAILALIEWAWPRVTSRVEEILGQVADYARPHPPMTVTTMCGEVLTGVLVVDRGQAILFVGIREPPAPQTPSRYNGRYYDEDVGPFWPHDIDSRQR